MNEYLLKLKTEAWRTSSARYWAARRLRRRELFSTVSLALFSATSIGIAVVQRVYVSSGSPTESYLTALSGCLGVLLLALSLMEWGSANGAKAEALHRNAEELNSFQRKVGFTIAKALAGDPTSWSDVEALRVEYEEIKQGCRYNHEPLDDVRFLAAHRLAPEFLTTERTSRYNLLEAAWIRVHWYCSSVWYFLLLWIAIGIAIAGAFFAR